MPSNEHPSWGALLLTFAAGAAIGALVAAFTTPKTGAELRGDLKDYGRRLRRKAGDALEETEDVWEEAKARTARAASDVKRGLQAAAEDLRG